MKARWSRQAVWSAGLLLLGMAFLAGSAQGAYAISPLQLLRILQDMVAGVANPTPEHLVFANIRLPRLLLGRARPCVVLVLLVVRCSYAAPTAGLLAVLAAALVLRRWRRAALG